MKREKLWLVADEVYVDVVENQVTGEKDRNVERELANSLESWLKSSEAEQKQLERLSQLRQAVKACDDVALPESGFYFEALEKRIVSALEVAIDVGDVKDRSKPVTPVSSVSTERFVLSRARIPSSQID